tara:strand:+ start:648 stop:1037 length:390 start_codon:yes stop_codon:yes gene_type:complete
MKFEANIPSYLKTGQGVFPVQQKTMAAERETTNLFEKLEQGADMPVANDGNMVALAPMGQDRIESRSQPENLLDKMQQNINRGIDEREFMPKSDVESDFKRVMPQIKPGVMREPTERMVQADGEDIFIG